MTAAVEQRIEALEVKAAYAEDLLERLNLALYRQQQAIDRLQAQLAQLRLQLRDSGEPARQADPRAEIPPHY